MEQHHVESETTRKSQRLFGCSEGPRGTKHNHKKQLKLTLQGPLLISEVSQSVTLFDIIIILNKKIKVYTSIYV